MKVSLNGHLIPLDSACLPLNDRGLLLGDGLFETFYFDGQKLECDKAHWQRLQKGLGLFEIPFLENFDRVGDQIMTLLAANKLIGQTAAVRLTITRGSSGRGLDIPVESSPVWLIQVSTYTRSSEAIHLAFSQHCHLGRNALSAVKHLGYQLPILGRLEARHKGVDDVLFVNGRGEVVGATAANIFVVINDAVVTPPLSSGCLPGTKRAQVITRLKAKGMQVTIRPLLWREVVEKTKAIFLTNSLIDIQPVGSIEGRNLPFQELIKI